MVAWDSDKYDSTSYKITMNNHSFFTHGGNSRAIILENANIPANYVLEQAFWKVVQLRSNMVNLAIWSYPKISPMQSRDIGDLTTQNIRNFGHNVLRNVFYMNN